MYAYIDESGDTGNTVKSSKIFILTAVIAEDGERFEKDIKNYLAKLIRINKRRPSHFHAHKENKIVLRNLIDISIRNEVEVLCHKYDKKEENMYAISLIKLLKDLEDANVENVFAASYISKVSFINEIKDLFPNMNIKFMPAANNKGLQAADCFSYIMYNGVQGRLEELYLLVKDRARIKQNP
mgnify:CR=1 FL=1